MLKNTKKHCPVQKVVETLKKKAKTFLRLKLKMILSALYADVSSWKQLNLNTLKPITD